jgi:hypothetical protein
MRKKLTEYDAVTLDYSAGTEVVKLNHPVSTYSDEVINRALHCINGNKPLDNIIDLSVAMSTLIMSCEDIEEEIKSSYCCLYSYLEFQLELLKEIADKE